MAAVRGRKRTEDPTPNRARDIQRAFRARRAAHLESLEDRIHELEDENNYFRALLNLPPANRPILGKGPTGRGLAKSRSRLSVDNFQNSSSTPPQSQSGAASPPSDSPTTPNMEYPIPLPAQHEPFAVSMPSDPNPSDPVVPFSFPTGEKIMDPAVVVDQFMFSGLPRSNGLADHLGGLPADFEAVRIGQDVPIVDSTINQGGIFPDLTWGMVPPTPVPDMQPSNQRAFGFTPQIAAPNGMPRNAMPTHMRPVGQGHRRSNTEPQSLGSLVASFNPGHRSSSSDIGTYGTPSPPPLPIRAGQYPMYQ